MPLRYKYDKKHEAEISKEARPFYVDRDGFLFLDVEGAVDVDQLNEFRDNNRELMRLIGAKTPDEAKTKLAKLKDVDPDEFARIKEELKKFEEGKAPKLDELLATRTATMKADLEKKISEKETSNAALQKRLEKVLIDDALATAAASKGVLASAIEDVKRRGRDVFKLEGENVLAFGADGKPRYGKNGKELSIEEWMDILATEAAHLFSPNKGGGASGGTGAGAGGYNKPNPYSKGANWNLTEQTRLEKENPALASRLELIAKGQ